LQIPNENVSSYGSINSAGTPFPGTSGKNAFTATTTPAMFTWTGLQTIFKPLTEIKEAADKTISFRFMDEPVEPVTNLQTEVTGGNVKLSWTAANHAEALGYKIYRNGALQYTVNNPLTTTFTQPNVPNGTYEYGVSVFYESSESATVTKRLTVSGSSNSYYLPVRNLQGNATLDKTSLSWEAPLREEWMTIAREPFAVYSYTNSFTFFAGTLWGPKHLKGLDGCKVTQIQFYLCETSATATHTIQIWEKDNAGTPQLMRNQLYTGRRIRGSKNVTLDSPLVIDASKEYFIGVEIHTQGGENCLVVDDNPIVSERNWMCIENEWLTMEEIRIEGNFCMAFYLSSGNSSSTQYIIYRDGTAISETTTTAFEDNNLTPEKTYSYCVSAVYGDNMISEGACIELITNFTTGVNTVNASVSKVYPNPVKSGRDFYVQTETPDTIIQIFSLSGTLLKQQQATGLITKMNVAFPAGIYILSTGKEKIKIVIQ
jgi:fibronectin type 3 domain-containing protein